MLEGSRLGLRGGHQDIFVGNKRDRAIWPNARFGIGYVACYTKVRFRG